MAKKKGKYHKVFKLPENLTFEDVLKLSVSKPVKKKTKPKKNEG